MTIITQDRSCPEYCLLGMGNPLLDISAEVSAETLERYGLAADNAILAEEKHMPLYAELAATDKVQYIAGGACQNSIRCAQWLLPAKSTTYIGCIGNDKYGRIIEEEASKDGLRTAYLVDEDTPTGTCAVCITGESRSLVANLSAANNYKRAHLELHPEVMREATHYYISGFFLTVSPETIMTVAGEAAKEGKVFAMNLSAPFLCQFFKEPMLAALPYVDVLFGNESEAEAFSEANSLGTKDVKEIALKISTMDGKINAARKRMVVITQGALPTVIAYDGVTTEYPVTAVAHSDIVDTNGAGDAFVGGFMSQLVQGKDVAQCIRAAHFMAGVIIRQSGCTFPEQEIPDFH